MFTSTIVAHKICQPLKYQIIKLICSEICMEINVNTHEIAVIVVLEVKLVLI